jgi:uncharacterized OB-fold protein
MAELDVTVRPLPQRRPESAPFWDGLLEHEIRLQRCTSCGQVQYYPRPGCRHCGATTLEWEAMSGEAEVYSYTVIHRAPFEAFEPDVPYVFAVVQLVEGPRLVSTIVTDDFDALEVGMALSPVYDRVADDTVLLRFRPA